LGTLSVRGERKLSSGGVPTFGLGEIKTARAHTLLCTHTALYTDSSLFRIPFHVFRLRNAFVGPPLLGGEMRPGHTPAPAPGHTT
jgi:hypothetical protein